MAFLFFLYTTISKAYTAAATTSVQLKNLTVTFLCFRPAGRKEKLKVTIKVKISWRSGSHSVYLSHFYYKYLEEKWRENRMR